MGPNCRCVLLQSWGCRWFLILHSICMGWGLHRRWVEGSSVQAQALGVALLLLLQFRCEGRDIDMPTWSHLFSPWSIVWGIFCELRLPNWLALTGIYRTCIVEAERYLFWSLHWILIFLIRSFDHGSIYLSQLSLLAHLLSTVVEYSGEPCKCLVVS